MLLTFNIRIEKYYITGKRGWHIYISQVLEQNFALSGIGSNDCTNTYTMYRVPKCRRNLCTLKGVMLVKDSDRLYKVCMISNFESNTKNVKGKVLTASCRTSSLENM